MESEENALRREKKNMKNLILQYEKDFFRLEFCKNRKNLESRLSKDFLEYGKSGSVYNRDDSISRLMKLPKDNLIEIIQFELNTLSDSVLLARYISHHKENNSYARRTSIWKIEDNEWKLYFHQGTSCDCPE